MHFLIHIILFMTLDVNFNLGFCFHIENFTSKMIGEKTLQYTDQLFLVAGVVFEMK